MTFDELIAAVAKNVYPDKIPRVLVPQFRDRVRDALIVLQRKVKQLRFKNIQIVHQDATYYRCGLSIFTAPRGYVTRVAIQHKDAPGCRGTNGVQVSKEEMRSLQDTCQCSALPIPINTTPIPPFNFYAPDPSIDRINPITYRKVSMFDGFIWWFPWFNSNEVLIVEWNGEKKSWDGSDLIPLSFLDESGQIDREVQALVELYVSGMKGLIGACDVNPVPMQVFDKSLVSYNISRKEMDDADLEKPYAFACRPYCSPALATNAGSKWDPPVISCVDVPRHDPPVITSVDTDDPITSTASTPVITPNVSTFTGGMLVTITAGTPAPSEIRYTLDGSEPGPGSLLYSAPFTIFLTTRVRAKSFKVGYITSAEADRTYTMVVSVTSPIFFSPSDGNFAGSVLVTLSTGTPFPYQIKFTIDGSSPLDPGGILYTTPFTLSASKLVRAVAVKAGYVSGPIDQKQYTKIVAPKVAPVQFNPVGGPFVLTTNVALSCATPGAAIYFTIDGTPPTVNPALLYTGAISLTATKTIKAIAAAPAFSNSDETQQTYTYLAKTDPVIFTPTGTNFIGTQSVGLSCITPGSVIHYTTNGSTPNVLSPVYSSAINLTATTTIKAIAMTTGYGDSDVGSQVYNLVVPQLPQVTFSPTSGNFAEDPSITMACAVAGGASIYFTTDGSIPSIGAIGTTLYSGPVSISATTTFKAMAVKPFYLNSTPSTKTYTKLVPVFPPGTYAITFDTGSAHASLEWGDAEFAWHTNWDYLIIPVGSTDTHVDIFASGMACQFSIGVDGFPAGFSAVGGGAPAGTDILTGAIIGTGPDTSDSVWFHLTIPPGSTNICFDGVFHSLASTGGIGFDIYLS